VARLAPLFFSGELHMQRETDKWLDTTEELANISKKISLNTRKRNTHTRALTRLERNLKQLREQMLALLMNENRTG
tara:strand:+ start:157 stop:384 length:228 start_codon:yes stop_codon:yes gene_type:complete